ncbi:MAG: hypothetical protein KIT14_06845 [bacterium]|nr:hypothetical protein [bacterium]
MSEPRAVVLPFPPRPGAERPAGCRPMPPGRSATEEHGLNAAWDELLWLAIQAWSWRDPESLVAIEEAVAVLQREVERDWS